MSISSKELEIWQKDKERKEGRIDSLQRELQSLRKHLQDQQKECKLKHGVIESLCEDKKKLERELSSLKEQHGRQAAKLSLLSQPVKLQQTILDRDQDIHLKEERISALEGEIILRDERVKVLEYELGLAHRAIAVQNKFEQHSNLPTSLGIEREKLRTLYFLLAKRQADNESLSESLALASDGAAATEKALGEQKAIIQQLQEEKLALASQLESEESLARSSTEQVESLSRQLSHYQAALADMEDHRLRQSSELQQMREALQENARRQEEKYSKVTAELHQAIENKQKAQQRLSSLETAIDQLHFSLQHTINSHEEEKRRLSDRLQEAEKTQALFDQLKTEHEQVCQRMEAVDLSLQHSRSERDSVAQQLLSSQQEINSLQFQLAAERSRSASLKKEIDSLTATMTSIYQERDHVVQALKQSMDVARGLMRRLSEEKAQREKMEQQLQEEMELRKRISLMMLDSVSQTLPPLSPFRLPLHSQTMTAQAFKPSTNLEKDKENFTSNHIPGPSQVSSQQAVNKSQQPLPNLAHEHEQRPRADLRPPSTTMLSMDIQQLKDDLLDLQDALCQGSDTHSVGSNSMAQKSSQSGSECDAQKLIITEDDSASNASGDSLDLLHF
eukprot:gene4869-5337_t